MITRNIIIPVVMGLYLSAFSCEKKDVPGGLKIDKIVSVEIGQTVENIGLGLSLQVLNINDSRCPADVQCVWEGNAEVEFRMVTFSGVHDFILDTHEPPFHGRDTLIDGYHLQLLDVVPYPDLKIREPVIRAEVKLSLP